MNTIRDRDILLFNNNDDDDDDGGGGGDADISSILFSLLYLYSSPIQRKEKQ